MTAKCANCHVKIVGFDKYGWPVDEHKDVPWFCPDADAPSNTGPHEGYIALMVDQGDSVVDATAKAYEARQYHVLVIDPVPHGDAEALEAWLAQ